MRCSSPTTGNTNRWHALCKINIKKDFMKKSIVIFLSIILSACNISTPLKTNQSPTIVIAVSTSTSLPQTDLQNTYRNSKYGYSLTYPSTLNVNVINDEYVEIGDKITVEVMSLDPTAPHGDGAVIESTSDIQSSGYPAKLLTGYIGSIGGYMPQQFKKIVVEQNGDFFVITLYALGLHVTDGDISQIAQLTPDDVSLFDNIVASIQIP